MPSWYVRRPAHGCLQTGTAGERTERRRSRRTLRTIAFIVALTALAPNAGAYSVLAHEANVDALWDSAIRPLIAKRYPRITREELQRARAYA